MIMKIKIFSNVNIRLLEREVNEFLQGKKVVEVKLSPGPSDSEAMNALVLYED